MKRFLALLLSCLMLLSLCPVALAAEAAPQTEEVAETEIEVTAPLLDSPMIHDYVNSVQLTISEPVELTEGVHGYWNSDWGSTDSSWFYYDPMRRSDLKFTVIFSTQGAQKYNNGATSFTGTASEIAELFYDFESWEKNISCRPVGYDDNQNTKHWQPGETHKMWISFAEVQWQEFTVKTVGGPVKSITVDAPDGIELTDGIDGYDGWYWDEAGNKFPFFYYTVDSHENINYTVTFSESGAEKYGMSSFIGKRWEVYNLLGEWPNWRDSQQDSQYAAPWQVGETHEVELQFMGKTWQTVQVTILPNPVESLSASLPNLVKLAEGIDGYEGAYWDDETQSEGRYFRYNVDPRGAVQYTLTLSKSGAERYNDGKRTFTGTLNEIVRLLGVGPEWSDDQSPENQWQVGQTHEVELQFMGKTWQTVQVATVSGPIESITADVSGTVELTEGISGNEDWYWDEKAQTEVTFFRYDVDPRDSVQYTVTFSEYGAERYGIPSFIGTRREVSQLLGVRPEWQSDQSWENQWQAGETHEVKLQFMGKTWQTVEVTIVPGPVVNISAKLPGTVELTEGINGDPWENGLFRYSVDPRDEVRYTVTFSAAGAEQYNGGKRTFTGTRGEIGNLLDAWLDWRDDQTSRNPWQAGKTYQSELYFMGKTWQTVTVKTLPCPVVDFSSNLPGEVTLWENVDGHLWNNDQFRYDIDSRNNVLYTVTLTEDAAKQHGLESTIFTGKPYEIEDLLGTWPNWEDDQYKNPWQAGETHEAKLQFMGKTWQIVQVTIKTCELPALAAATELSWGRQYKGGDSFVDHPGYISWRANRPMQAEYRVAIYRKNADGTAAVLCEFVSNFPVLAEQQSKYNMVDEFCTMNPGTGDYYFTVEPLADYISYQNGPVAASGTYHYVRPEAKLPQLEAPKLNETGFVWEGVVPREGSSFAEMQLYFSETENGDFRNMGRIQARYEELKFDAEDGFFQYLLEENGNGCYYAVVRALSDNIERWQNGAWSVPSKLLKTGDNTEKVQQALGQISTEAPAEDIREAVQGLNKALLLETMTADQDNTGVMEQLAQLEEAVGGPAKVEVDAKLSEAFGSDKVSVVGANLNNPTDSGKNITLQVGAPKEEDVIPERYDSTMAVKFSMELENTDSTELDVPVKIILPVPKNINPRFLAILHYHHDGSVEELINPYVYVENGQTYVTFVLTSFSDFALAQKIYDPGDLNLDDVVNIQDVQALFDLLAQDMEPKSGEDYCDINGDKVVNILDYQKLYEMTRAQ